LQVAAARARHPASRAAAQRARIHDACPRGGSRVKTRRFTFGLLALLAVGAGGGCSWLKQMTKKPRVTLQKVDLVGVDFQSAKLRADLELENRVPATVKLAKIDWGVKIEGADLVSG